MLIHADFIFLNDVLCVLFQLVIQIIKGPQSGHIFSNSEFGLKMLEIGCIPVV